MSQDNTFRAFMDRLKVPDFTKVDWVMSTQGLRDSFYKASRAAETDLPELAEISNLLVDGAEGPLKARLYVPLAVGVGPRPAIVFYHGGGFMVGDLDSHDVICRRLAHASRCRVLAIDYRLSPENKFPAAHDDALAAWTWATERGKALNFDPDRLAVAGDSAGGNLAAYLAQQINRTEGVVPAFQLLLYPLLQFADIRSKKMTFQEGGFFISPTLFDYFRDNYVADEADRLDPRMSPLFAPDHDFVGLPPAHFVLCGWDPLRDEAKAYAAKLAAHGVPNTIREHPGMVHGFMNMTGVSTPARDAIQAAGEVVGKALGALD